MRLMICSNEFPPGPGGVGTQARQIAMHLSRRGWAVLVASPQDYAPEAEIAAFNSAQPFSVVRLPGAAGTMRRVASSWRSATRAAKAWKPDLLAGTGDRAMYLSALLAARFSIPRAVIEHGKIATGWEGPLKRRCLESADAVVCVSAYTRRRLLEAHPHLPQVEVIHNGADPEIFRPLPEPVVAACRERLSFGSGRLLLTVGNVTRRKGQDVVIRALPQVLEFAPGTQYLIAGLPTLRDEYTALARRLGVARHVHFLGRVETAQLVELMNCCDLFVMTSRHTSDQFEGFGIAVIEAALCARPAVVSAGSGLEEAVVHGATGLTVPEDDAGATAAAIISLLENDGRRAAFGQAARLRALQSSTWERVVECYDRVFRGVLGVKPSLSHSASFESAG